MNSILPLFPPRARPALPAPTRERWQPLRLGLVELFHYDSEEFWFRDGHLLLRGANGAGKSKVLSLTLPFLFDAQMKSSRIEPDGDPGKKMAWNLLMNSYDRRTGYAWIEFGRVASDGAERFLTLGAGLSATAARPQVDSWFFILDDAEDAPRINQDLWLLSPEQVVLGKEWLRSAVEGRGQVFDTAASYRRAVDERLFHLGTKRYDALMDTLIQLRQPQLSRKPDEALLSGALTEALPPLAPELLADVAEALGRLEEDRRQLDEYQALARAVQRFDGRYRLYAGAQSRRQARALRQAQTDFDNASRARGDAQARLEEAQAQEARARADHDTAELALTAGRTRLDTLLADPAMQDANRLENADADARARRETAAQAEAALAGMVGRLQRAAAETRSQTERAAQAEHDLASIRQAAAAAAGAVGVTSAYAQNTLAALDAAGLLELVPDTLKAAEAGLRALAASRRAEIALLRRRHADVAEADALHARHRQAREERTEAADAAYARRTRADSDAEHEGRALAEAWSACFAKLAQLHLAPDAPLDALEAWVLDLNGDNPAQEALRDAQQHATRRLAARRQDLLGQRHALETERQVLEAERVRLADGVDAEPPIPYTRDAKVRDGRAGAPLWRLVDFREGLGAAERGGLESALEASGLLDAWVSPDGRLQADDGRTLLDTQVALRPARAASLAGWLQASVPPGCPIPAFVVEQVLAGVAGGEPGPGDVEDVWVALDGRFRLGALTGAWTKPSAVYIGVTARAAARAQRLAELAAHLARLAGDMDGLQAQMDQHAQAESQAEAEWRGAPKDQALRQAHLAAAASARDYHAAHERRIQADDLCRDSERACQVARLALAHDAADLRLPELPDALPGVEQALSRFDDAWRQLAQAVSRLRLVQPELDRQREREAEVEGDVQRLEAQLAGNRLEAEQAAARLQTLRDAVGAKIGELKLQLSGARDAVAAGERTLKANVETLRQSGEARAVADEKAQAADSLLRQRSDARAEAVAKLQAFTSTGLLLSALPDIELPEMRVAWTIDPALALARRMEHALEAVKDDDDAWSRVQRQIMESYEELQRALSALGHQTAAHHAGDWGFVVHIVYQNRPERPDRLAARLAAEVAQREELLTANERAVLENHLQAEIAAEIQRLLQVSEKQVNAINAELHKRPTSTGVRYRLLWRPLAEEEGAPVGLDAARKRLLNTSTDLWSPEDRRVVGAMLQQRIAAERERADSAAGKDGGGALFDQLARALDYRRWHRFRVERWQDGQWRKLSGPASSGERALGLTVPLFAAVASFYSQGSHALAPRLMLLDEVFAGIDDAARAHCMGLIREFDLDFVITSEREWACYAELPGVAICQLQRREGVDAVFVSRWTWDGQAKASQPDPDRRFALA